MICLYSLLLCLVPQEPVLPEGFVLPEGHVAWTLKIIPSEPTDGFILPGSKVDVIHSITDKDGKVRSSTLLKNVLVVACDVSDTIKNSFILAVKKEDAKKLKEAENKSGEWELRLRNPSAKD